jgi:hypothetical protein
MPDIGSRVQQQQQKRRRRGNCLLSYLFCSHKFLKTENYFIFEQIPKIFLSQSTKNYGTFYPKIVTKLSEIWVEDPGSGKAPDPQHCYRSDLQIILKVMTITLSAGPQLIGGGHCAQHH